MRTTSFRYCMLIGATALVAVAVYYFFNYSFRLSVALDNNHFEPFLEHSIRAQWLAFASHALLIALLYVVVAFKPHAVSREVIVILGLLQLVECVLLFVFSDSNVAAGLLIAAAVFVLLGSALWPPRLPQVAAGQQNATSAGTGDRP
jgi:hypothetical protein